MKKKLRAWLAGVSSAFPTTFSPYRRMLPLGRMKMFLAGTSSSAPLAVSPSIYCSSTLPDGTWRE